MNNIQNYFVSFASVTSVVNQANMTSNKCDYCGLAWLPIFAFGLACLTLICSYSISTARGVTDTALPFISDTGTIPPASCWFGLLLNATAYTLAFAAVVRFLQIREQLTHRKKAVCGVNISALVFAMIGSLGLSVVACFQETSVLSMHIVGANMAFSSAAIYACLQNYLTLTLIRQNFSKYKWIFVLRVVLSIICVITLFTTVVPIRFAGYKLPPYDEKKRPYEEAEFYYLSTVSEWTLAVCFFVYILTFSYEFQFITLSIFVDTHERYIGDTQVSNMNETAETKQKN